MLSHYVFFKSVCIENKISGRKVKNYSSIYLRNLPKTGEDEHKYISSN